MKTAEIRKHLRSEIKKGNVGFVQEELDEIVKHQGAWIAFALGRKGDKATKKAIPFMPGQVYVPIHGIDGGRGSGNLYLTRGDALKLHDSLRGLLGLPADEENENEL